MTVIEHNKILAIGFGVFAAIFAFTFLLSFPAYLFLPWVRVWSGEDHGRSQSAPA